MTVTGDDRESVVVQRFEVFTQESGGDLLERIDVGLFAK